MQLHLLVTPDLPDKPDDIRVLEDFGSVQIHSDGEFFCGTHLAIECDETSLRAWLGSVDGFWLGEGQPFQQHFKVVHLKGPDEDPE